MLDIKFKDPEAEMFEEGDWFTMPNNRLALIARASAKHCTIIIFDKGIPANRYSDEPFHAPATYKELIKYLSLGDITIRKAKGISIEVNL